LIVLSEARMGSYGSLLIPAVVALVLLFLIVRVVGAIVKLVVLVVLVAVLVGAYGLYGRISSVQKVADALSGQNLTSAGVARSVARQAAASAGLNPAFVQVECAGGHQLQLRYADDSFAFGILSRQDFTVPLAGGAHC
jgi:hypothetical protein